MEIGRTSTSHHRREISSLRTHSQLSTDDFRVHGGAGGIAMLVPREGVSASILTQAAFIAFFEENGFVLPSDVHVPTRSRGASREVFQRLTQEQRVVSKDLGEENETHECSICIEDLSKKKYIIKMPRCSHMFHEKCLFEWLDRENSCPLCRSVPYE